MLRRAGLVLAALTFALVGLGAVFVITMRLKVPLVQDALRRFNRAVANPRAMETAGRPDAYASIIRHIGRKTGSPYETPVGTFPTDNGFLIALTYGRVPDWLKNVLAAGSAVIVSDGRTYNVDTPEIVHRDEVMASIPTKEQRVLGWFKVDELLRVRLVDEEPAVEDIPTVD